MAFKRKSKTKKPKKSSKKNRDSEWAFEGGVSYDNISTEDPKQYKRIHTQEKDERFRRGRLKVEERKRKQHFVNKMSKRVKFSDVWKSDDGEKDEEPTEQEEEAERQRRSQNPNPLPVLDRLQFFLQHSLSGNDENQDSMSVDDEVSDCDDEEHERDNTLESSLLAQMQDKNYDFLVFGKELNKEGGDIDEHDVNDDDHDLIGDEENDNKTSQPQENPYLPWFFQSSVVMDRDKSSLIKELTSRHKPQPLSTVTLPYNHEEKVTLYQARNKSLPEHSLEGIETVQDIPSLYKLWKSKAVTSSSSSGVQLNNFSKEILPKLLTYSDIFIEGRNHINDKLILETLLMHSLFHVVRSRAVVVKHNQRIKQKENLLKKKLGIDNDVIDIDKISESLKNNNNKGKNKKKNSKKTSDDISNTLEQAKDDDVSDEVMKDQGFVRPRLLILTPLRSTAKRVVHQMVRILGENTSVSGLQKFDDEYSDLENNDDVSVDWGEEYYRNHRGSGGSNDFGGRRQPGEKPEDWQALFRGNIDDDFKVGIQINPGHGKGKGGQKGVYVKLFSDFYLSDIIVASPIGLKFVLESRPASTASHPNNIDFLSSIEQVIVHQFDVLAYQNLEHVHDIFHHLNQLPRENHSQTDYSRIRPYFLNGCASYYRQLMITSAFNTPELQSFFREYATSHAGWIRCKKSWNENGVISNVIVPKVKQMFQVIPLSSSTTHMGDNDHDVSMVEVYEDRKFQFFKEKILSKITGLKQSRVLIVIPSYFDFVKVRNEMMKEEMNAAYISEYSRESEISRGRSRFYQGIKDILVYSGRAHFFRRFRIRGAKHVIFYSLPEYPHFYSEIVNMLGDFRSSNHQEGEEQDDDEEKNVAVQDSVRDDDEDYTSVALCSELDQMALERVVGKKRCDHMLQSKKTTFLFF